MDSERLPFAKVFSDILNLSPGFVPRVNLAVHDMAVCQSNCQEVVHMCRETPEARFIAHESMDIDEQKLPSAMAGMLWYERLLGRGARIIGRESV
jgi:hypothetical protein